MIPTLKKWLTVAAVLLLIVILAVVAEWQYTLRRRDPRLDAIRAKLDETEPGWRLEDIERKQNETVLPAKDNVAEIFRTGVLLVPSSFREWQSTRGGWRYEVDLGQKMAARNMSELTEQLPILSPALDVFHRSRKFNRGGRHVSFAEPFPYDKTVSDDLYRALDILDWAILGEANQGHGEVAIDHCRTQLHLRIAGGEKPIGSSRWLANHAIHKAIHNSLLTLGLTEPRDGLVELQAELVAALMMLRNDTYLVEGRASVDRTMLRVAEGRIDADTFLEGVGLSCLKHKTESYLAYTLGKRYAKSNHADLLNIFTAARDAMRKRGTDRVNALRTMPFPAPKSVSNILVYLFAEGLERRCFEDIRDEARIVSMVVAIACERHRQRTGQWPESLSAIPRDLLTSIPSDPFADGPVCYQKFDQGIVVYSVGRNGIDEEGRNLKSIGNDDVMVPGDDDGVFLFSPKYRAKPKREGMDDPN